MDKKFISFPDPDEYEYLLEGLDKELFQAFAKSPTWMTHIRKKHHSGYANKSFEIDGRYRSGFGCYITERRYIKQMLEHELNNETGDRMEYVYNFTRNPELAVKCMKFDKQDQISFILRKMENMSYNQKCVYAERIIAKGKRVAQEGGYSQVFQKAARQ